MNDTPGKWILIVEDEFLLATLTSDILREQGYMVVGPAPTKAMALDLIRSCVVDGAILDYNLVDGTSHSIAQLLQEKGTPFFFLTGSIYKTDVESLFPEALIIPKPFREDVLIEMLTTAFGPA